MDSRIHLSLCGLRNPVSTARQSSFFHRRENDSQVETVSARTMSSEKKFVLYTAESLATTVSPMTTTFDMSKRYSSLSSVSVETDTTMNKSDGIKIGGPGLVVAHTSPYYYEKHILQEHYDDQGVRQGSWGTGLCNFMTCAPMTFGFCFALPCVSVAQISTRLGLASYRRALIKQFVNTIFVFGLAIATYFLVIKMNQFPDVQGEDKGPKKDDVTKTLWTLALWIAFGGWVIALLLVALSLSDLRLKIRTRYGIPKSRLGDFGEVVCMPSCAIAQMSSHLRCMRPGRYTLQCPETLPPYEY